MENNEQVMNKDSKRKGKKIWFIITLVCTVLVTVVASVVGILVMNSPKNQLKRALDDKDFDKVVEICMKEDSSDLSEILKQYVSETVKNYGCGNIDYDTVYNIFLRISTVVHTQESMNVVNEIQKSKLNYEKAVEYIDNEDYVNALICLEKVIEKDTQNYDVSIKKIDEVLELQISKAETELEKKNYDAAYTMIEKIERYSQITERVENIKNAILQYQNELTAEAQNLFDNGKYLEAYNYVKKIDSKYVTDNLKDIKSVAKENYVSGQLASAKIEFDSNNYQIAINILTDANKEIADNRFTSKIKEYEKYRNSVIMNNYSSKVRCEYDTIDKEYKITSKGLSSDSITINYNRNLQANIVLKDGKQPMFFLYFGFVRSDWLFMEKIIIDCDGTQYSIDVDYWERITDISGGNITEAYGVANSNYKYEEFKQLMNLEPIINGMIGADVVTIRFKGKGYFDKVIPKSHIEEIKILWQIYNILKDNPELASEL